MFLAGLSIRPVHADNCASIFGVLKQGHSAKTAIVQSPDGRTSAWSEATMQKSPSVLYTTLYIRESKQTSITFRRDLAPDGYLRGYKDPLDSGSYDAYCAVDWSADSRLLLVNHTRGPQGSDHLDIDTWVFDRLTKKRQRTNPTELAKNVEWYSNKRQFRSGLYHLIPIGWESAMLRRIVFAALPSPGEEDDLGIWSTETDGRSPKLLEEQSRRYTPKRFSKPENPT